MRAFVAIPLPADLKERVGVVQRRLDSSLGHNLVRWTGPDQLHLTLRFYGNVAEADVAELAAALRRATAGVPAFELNLTGLGGFPTVRRPTVIWLGLEGDLEPLLKLQRQIEHETARFGSHSESRAFHPHLTVGRVKPFGDASQRVGQVLGSEIVERVGTLPGTRVQLVQSQLKPTGSVYTILEEVLLKGGIDEVFSRA
jgi:2'-5' RNA ligase